MLSLLVGLISLLGTGVVVAEPVPPRQSIPGQNAAVTSESITPNYASSKADLPNIIFLLADDLGYGDVGYNGGNAETPNLDAMAAGSHSIELRRFYSGGPVCSPTRGTVLTGRNHNRYCVWRANTVGMCGNEGDFMCPSHSPLPVSEVTVAEILKTRGYHTAIFGKWHLGDLKSINGRPTSHPGQHGFDVWKVTERSAPTANLNCACFNTSLCVIGHYKKKAKPPCTNYHTSDPTNNTQLISHNEPILGDDSNFLVSEFEGFLNQIVNSSEPFFAYIPFHTVHKRYVATAAYYAMYRAKGYTSNEKDYYGAITAMDSAIGKIQELLIRHNIYNNTMLWFTSDNGPEAKSPGSTAGFRGRKGELYEGGIRVPGILQWPAVIKQNRVSSFPVITSDFLPTVCDIVGASLPDNRTLDGRSLLPFIRGQANGRLEPIMWAFNIKGNFSNRRTYTVAMSTNRYKVLVQYKFGQVINSSMFDLLNDPQEQNDISTTFPELLNRYLEEIEAWRQSVIRSAESEVGCLHE